MLQITKYFILQLQYDDFKLNSTIFSSTFYTLVNGVHKPEGKWEAGPNDDNNQKHIDIAKQWADLVSRKEKFIPIIAAKGTGDIVNLVKQMG